MSTIINLTLRYTDDKIRWMKTSKVLTHNEWIGLLFAIVLRIFPEHQAGFSLTDVSL